jgi:4-hydroxy-3-methylbut-2-enyl diphosphate reductase
MNALSRIASGKQILMPSNCSTLIAAPVRFWCVDRATEIVENRFVYGARSMSPPRNRPHQPCRRRVKIKGAISSKNWTHASPATHWLYSSTAYRKRLAEAERRNMIVSDATCPLFPKCTVSNGTLKKMAAIIIFVGHEGHPEVIGTM